MANDKPKTNEVAQKGEGVKQHKRMAMGQKVVGKMGGGMMAKGYRKGGACG